MRKFSMMLGILFALTCCQAYAQTAPKAANMPYLTAQGTILAVDEESGIVTVSVNGKPMVFFLTGQSKLFQPTQHMATIELEKDDPVMVQYVVSSSGENKVVNLIDSRDEILKS